MTEPVYTAPSGTPPPATEDPFAGWQEIGITSGDYAPVFAVPPAPSGVMAFNDGALHELRLTGSQFSIVTYLGVAALRRLWELFGGPGSRVPGELPSRSRMHAAYRRKQLARKRRSRP